MIWTDIKKYHFNPPEDKNVFKRSEIMEETYQKYKNSFIDSKFTMENEIQFQNPDLELFGYSVSPNRFPYLFDDFTCHFILWVHPNNLKLTMEKIKTLVKYWYQEDKVVIFENHSSNRSIFGLPHYHIFLKSNQFIMEFRNDFNKLISD